MKSIAIVIVVVVVVAALLLGLLLTLRSSRNAGMPGAEVMDRAKKRAESQAAAEKDE